jgi:hypothetical protein
VSRSWGWRIVEFAEGRGGAFASLRCRNKKCDQPAQVYVAYDYVTGRGGRVTTNERPYCRTCAAQVVAQHEVRS